MANQKKTLLVFTSVDADVLRNGSAAALEKLRQKGAASGAYQNGVADLHQYDLGRRRGSRAGG